MERAEQDSGASAPADTPLPPSAGHRPPTAERAQALEARVLGAGRRRRRLAAALLLVILAFGVWLRLASLPVWLDHPERTFFNGDPLLTNYDGYFFLSQARDLVEGNYSPVDTFRTVPEHQQRPMPPPLLSLMAAGIYRATPFSLLWVACVLPALLGVSLALPLYGIGRLYGGAAMGLSAAFLSVLSVGYLTRTHFGWFDTDCLNVTFAMTLVYFCLRFAREPGRRRYGYLAAALTAYVLFHFWWNASLVVTALASAPLAAALLWGTGTGSRRWAFWAAILSAFLILTVWLLPEPWQIFRGMWKSYIAGKSAGDFPSIGASISELRRLPLDKMVARTTGTWTVFLFSGVGLLWLFFRHPRDIVYFSAILGVAALSFFLAGRLIIFLVPALCLGAGFVISRAWALRRTAWPMVFLVPPFVLLTGYLPYYYGSSTRYLPNVPMSFIAALDRISTESPADTVVWAWWDHGYPVRYWAQRATVSDGGAHGGERVVYMGIPLATDDPRLAANFIQFFVSRGITGIHSVYQALGDDPAKGLELIKAVMAAGPEEGAALLSAGLPAPALRERTLDEWLAFFFPRDPRPVLLLMEGKLTQIAYWWYWFGTWDPATRKGVHARFKELPGLMPQKGKLVSRSGVTVDMHKGLARLDPRRRQAVGLWEVAVIDGDRFYNNIFPNPDGPVFQYLPRAKLGAVMDRAIAGSVFNRLFSRRLEAPPYLTLWGKPEWTVRLFEVQGDRLKAAGDGTNDTKAPARNRGLPGDPDAPRPGGRGPASP
jgi:dolichyl-diphosphooligosaccharide--protein glycosyltransferase